jgi:hypothetical protein
MRLRNAIKARVLAIVTCLVLTVSPFALADEQEDLAKESQNPIGNMISLPFENNTHFKLGPDDKWANVLNLKPVYPVTFGKLMLINRLIVPIIYLKGQDVTVKETTDVGAEEIRISTDDEFGLGNITYQGFFRPAQPGKITWGLGPVLQIPTNTDEKLGVDRWSAGPTFVALAKPGRWLLGCLVQNIWDFAGESNEPDVNKFSFQYFLNYNLDKGWYLTTSPTITADWEAKSGEEWTVPIGGGAGRLVRFGKQPVDFKLAAYYNVEKPKYAPDWSLQFQVKLLFPK